MLKIEQLDYEELSDFQKEIVPNNGNGKEYANYIKITHNETIIYLQSDAMEKKDAVFYRDLSWIPEALKRCYELGRLDQARNILKNLNKEVNKMASKI